MKKVLVIIFVTFFLTLILSYAGWAQCSICAKSVQQMGAKPAQGFNSGILYLMLVPYGAIGVIGYRWWRSNR
ncbi:MAG: hypothetical protein M3R50_07340 [Bacteroidota bacterium]|nr:hypothetical protein [Bacteroidota bacterium]